MTYTVGEAARILGVATSTLRYYESEGLLPTLGRSAGGQRVFTDREMEACRVIECLKSSGLSIREIKSFMDMAVEGDTTLAARLELFETRRQALAAEMSRLQEVMGVLEFKCWYYRTALEAGTEAAVRDLPDDQIPEAHRTARELLTHTHR